MIAWFLGETAGEALLRLPDRSRCSDSGWRRASDGRRLAGPAVSTVKEEVEATVSLRLRGPAPPGADDELPSAGLAEESPATNMRGWGWARNCSVSSCSASQWGCDLPRMGRSPSCRAFSKRLVRVKLCSRSADHGRLGSMDPAGRRRRSGGRDQSRIRMSVHRASLAWLMDNLFLQLCLAHAYS